MCLPSESYEYYLQVAIEISEIPITHITLSLIGGSPWQPSKGYKYHLSVGFGSNDHKCMSNSILSRIGWNSSLEKVSSSINVSVRGPCGKHALINYPYTQLSRRNITHYVNPGKIFVLKS